MILGLEHPFVDSRELLVDFHELKEWAFLNIDAVYDHRLALHTEDPLIEQLADDVLLEEVYPGLVMTSFLPTVENLAQHFGRMLGDAYPKPYVAFVELWEGDSNCAVWRPNGP